MPLVGPFPREGDLIEYSRPGYQHWAIYVGGGKIVHLMPLNALYNPVDWLLGYLSVVKEETFEAAAAFIPNVPTTECYYRVNNKYDWRSRPFPPLQIVKAARKEVGKKKTYNLMENNCEHFVTGLRYGKGFSDQAAYVKEMAGGLWDSVNQALGHWN
ncbi:hypothetical protein GDO81_018560 [Engystomops pustulosus]|uniref:LRAT domain-containing protein n=1 Tax=Engystomops pustulosus TaxID=76066 RepID=A0AAV6ZNQ2_ENGPU|nr:hypothetical protein GDO81_018560 [Engystomops pustulosus]KAG8549954.1 hypothetical protein GDO81_018560 [Engystomops pustulosus]KAG8549955.1 hypothetical protein GDO81_018560 [Engystomops pustulosus]KAG8549956.1 hypothetical protein GDO81_018560 [Engystomops pustulosus]